jgi:hypothetical protein
MLLPWAMNRSGTSESRFSTQPVAREMLAPPRKQVRRAGRPSAGRLLRFVRSERLVGGEAGCRSRTRSGRRVLLSAQGREGLRWRAGARRVVQAGVPPQYVSGRGSTGGPQNDAHPVAASHSPGISALAARRAARLSVVALARASTPIRGGGSGRRTRSSSPTAIMPARSTDA